MGLSTQFQHQIDSGLMAREELQGKSPEQQVREYAAGVAAGGGAMVSGLAIVDSQDDKIKRQKKLEQDHADFAHAIEQQRQEMLNQLDAAIGNLTIQIERDQEILAALEKRKAALTDVKDLLVAEQFDKDIPEHAQLADDAGLDPEKPVNLATVNDALGVVETKITKMVNKISDNMDKLDILVQAQTDLDNAENLSAAQKAVVQQQVENRLKEADISLEELSAEKGGFDQAIGNAQSVVQNAIEQNDIDVEDLTAKEQVAFIKEAKSSGMSPDDISGYKELLSEEAIGILEGESNNLVSLAQMPVNGI